MLWEFKTNMAVGNRIHITQQLGTLFQDETPKYCDMGARSLIHKVNEHDPKLSPKTCSPILNMLRFRVLKSEDDVLFLTTKMSELVRKFHTGDSLQTYESFLLTVRCAANLFHWL